MRAVDFTDEPSTHPFTSIIVLDHAGTAGYGVTSATYRTDQNPSDTIRGTEDWIGGS